jgi:hypothetical protein
VAKANVRVETVELDSAGRRQIGQRGRTTALLRDRADDVESAVQEASAIVQKSVAKVQDEDGSPSTSPRRWTSCGRPGCRPA